MSKHFEVISNIGNKLAALHLNFEQAERHTLWPDTATQLWLDDTDTVTD